MSTPFSISFVVPAYRASATIAATLRSVFSPAAPIPAGAHVEAVVVDDGSPDVEALAEVVGGFPGARLLRHGANLGMCAGRNTGIGASTGGVVTILDSDDELVSDWPAVLTEVLGAWPDEVNVCFSPCRTPSGRVTVSRPEYSGPLTFQDLLLERYPGEYLPLFRGDYVRARGGYADLGMRRSCGIVSYLAFAEEGSFWVTPEVLRIYHDDRPGSVTSNGTDPRKMRELARCYEELFARYGRVYAEQAPRMYRAKMLQYAVYLELAGDEAGWRTWARAAHWGVLPQSAAALLMLVFGRSFTARLVRFAKRMGVIKRYG